MQIYGKTDVGRVRVSNQDAFGILQLDKDVWFAVVCDGMGGANAGNIASATATEMITEYVKRSYREGLSMDQYVTLLQNAIRSANIAVFDLSQKKTEYSGMGTTVVAVIIAESNFAVAHVGDSRAYIIGKDIHQITRDHSVVQNLIESGELTPEEAKKHPRKNVITRALGISDDICPECNIFELDDTQTLLLCSDGLTNFTESADLLDMVQHIDPEKLAETLVARANHNGGGDNITAVIAKR